METKNIFDNKVIIIDKPYGHTSHEITTFVKKIMSIGRSGHAGTLDPQVSGVLPIALGRATKLLRYIAGKEKTYIGIIKFKNPQNKEQILKLFEQFTGEITQTPPKISAVRKKPRKRIIYYLKLLEVKQRLALFETKVDAGTYIRTLCTDIGKKCGGARMEELRRISVGGITEKQSYSVQEVMDGLWIYKNKKDDSIIKKMLRNPEEFIELPKGFIKQNALQTIFSGAQVMVPAVERFEDSVEKGKRVALYAKKQFIGVGIAQISAKEIEKRKKGLAIKLERVHKPE